LRRVPLPRLLARLGLTAYDRPAPFRPFAPPRGRLVVALKQHAGAPATLAVKAGQRVRQGDVLGEIPEKALGARVHASAAGTVVAADATAVTIEVG
jgi:Na+-translocating ferredoxin:NAD+ oxidoreductase RnfC subunit